MSARLESAADAVMDAAFGQELPEAPMDLAEAAVKAADEVMFSNENAARVSKASGISLQTVHEVIRGLRAGA